MNGQGVENIQVARAAGVVGGATMLSRIFGYIRDMVIAYLFGAGMAADAFFVAFRIPNLLRRLFGEGSLTVSFIPVFTDYLTHRSREEAREVADITFTLLSFILTLITVLGIIFSPVIVTILAPGFRDIPEKYQIAIFLNRVMFPYVLLVCLVALSMGILNSLRHFFAPAFAPVILNLCMITAALALYEHLELPVLSLAIGVVAAGVLQLAFQFPFLARRGFLPRLNLHFRHPAVLKIGLLMLPAVIGLAVYNLNVLVNTNLASMISQGAVSYLYYADRLMELPLGVFAIAIGTAVMPSMARQASMGRFDELKDTLAFALRMVFAIIVPAMAGLIVLRVPIINILFQRGEFDANATVQTARALLFYAMGLWAFSAVRVIVPTFYSLKDFWTPVAVAVIALMVNLTGALVFIGPLESEIWPALARLTSRINLTGPMQHAGLALATSLASTVQVIILITVLRRRLGPIGLRSVLSSLAKVLVASGLMAVAVGYAGSFFDWTGTGLTLEKLAGLVFAIGIGIAVYVCVSLMIRNQEVLYALRLIGERLRMGRRS